MPPLTGAARAQSHRRQPLPLHLQLIQVLRSTPRSSLMLVRALLAHLDRSPGTPVNRHGRRTSPSPSMFHYRPSSTFPSKQLPRSRRSCPVSPPPPPAGHLAASENAPGPIGRPPSGPGRGICASPSFVLGTQAQNTEDPPPNGLLFHVNDAAAL
jgi:hypothetical protein